MTLSIDISQFGDVFFEEAQELLAEMESLLLAIDVDAPDKEECNSIFRTAHSIKGGAAAFEMNDMVEVTHIMESLLDRIRKAEIALTDTHVNVFLQAKDLLKLQLNAHREKQPFADESAVEVMRKLSDLVDQEEKPRPQEKPVEPPKKEESNPGASKNHFYRVEMPAIAEEEFNALLAELGAKPYSESTRLPNGVIVLGLETDINADDLIAVCSFLVNPEDIKLTEEASQIRASGNAELSALWVDTQPEAEEKGDDGILDDFISPVPQAQADEQEQHAQPSSALSSAGTATETAPLLLAPSLALKTEQPGPVPRNGPDSMVDLRSGTDRRRQGPLASGGQESTSIRVNLEKVDQLINLVGELVITQAMIDQHAGGLDATVHESLLNSFATLARNSRDLQEAIMSIRMMPMDFVFSRFPRMSRELAAKLGKQVKLVTQGGATELDKGLIERITDPLTHLVRNAIDHGLETPSIRRAAGKSETGVLLLSAAHEGGNIIIEVSDDGAGLNRERIVAKARENGLAMPDEMSDEEVWQVIFAPGFSTCAEVTDVSGRGVGMDVVKRNISAMGGSVDIRSTRGQGSTFKISLPLTLAILEGMSVKTGEEIYILPLASVIESLKPAAESTRGITGKGRVIRVREEYLPLIPMHEVFGIEARYTDPQDGIVVVLEAEGKKAALLVDSLVGQQQVVVKNIESNYRRISGISGATILGDGNVSLILDVPSLLRMGSHF